MKAKYAILSLLALLAIISWKVFSTEPTLESLQSSLSETTVSSQNVEARAEETSSTVPAEAEIGSPVPSLEDFESEFKNLRNEEIEKEIQNVKTLVESKDLIKKANEKRESPDDKRLLNESIRKIAALYKLLIDRKIDQMKERL